MAKCIHHWIIDSAKVGRCRYCKEVRDFGKLQDGDRSQEERSRRGGEARKVLKRKPALTQSLNKGGKHE
jgi:hypothetical protein